MSSNVSDHCVVTSSTLPDVFVSVVKSANPPTGHDGQSLRRESTGALFVELGAATQEHQRDVLRQRIVELNMPVAAAVARRYHARGVDPDDLQQVAYVGLIKAVRRFDYTLDHDFLSFAVPTITGEVKRYFRDSCWAVRPPRRIQELQTQIPVVRERLTQGLRRRPTLPDIAEALGVSAEDVAEAMAATGCFTPASLDEPDSTGERSAIGQIVDHRLKGLARSEDHVFVTQLLQHLSDRDRAILQYRYVDGLTQHQIAQQVGVTQMQVSRLLSRLLRDLAEHAVA